MRMILFFDLPTVTKKDKLIYSRYRKLLLKKGFIMLQFSVYSKIYGNRDSAYNDKTNIIKISPEKGNVRIMIVTEKQYASMEVIVGGKSRQEKIITEDSFLLL